jgi:hypothetical protein
VKDGYACVGLGLSGRRSGDGLKALLLGGRADQGDGRPMPYHARTNVRVLRIVAVPDRD